MVKKLHFAQKKSIGTQNRNEDLQFILHSPKLHIPICRILPGNDGKPSIEIKNRRTHCTEVIDIETFIKMLRNWQFYG